MLVEAHAGDALASQPGLPHLRAPRCVHADPALFGQFDGPRGLAVRTGCRRFAGVPAARDAGIGEPRGTRSRRRAQRIFRARSGSFASASMPTRTAFRNDAQTHKACFELHDRTSGDLKSDSRRLRVGEPATASPAWVPAFLHPPYTHHVPVDSVSTHACGDPCGAAKRVHPPATDAAVCLEDRSAVSKARRVGGIHRADATNVSLKKQTCGYASARSFGGTVPK